MKYLPSKFIQEINKLSKKLDLHIEWREFINGVFFEGKVCKSNTSDNIIFSISYIGNPPKSPVFVHREDYELYEVYCLNNNDYSICDIVTSPLAVVGLFYAFSTR